MAMAALANSSTVELGLASMATEIEAATEVLTVEEVAASVDALFVIVMSIFILMLQPGFAFLEAGSVRAKNTTNILMKNLLDLLLGALAFWLVGFMFASSEGNAFLGTDPGYLALWGRPDTDLAGWFFSFSFCATAATIVSGAMAERCELTTYFLYSTLLSGLIYPAAARWAWADAGWLAAYGYRDFAGSGVVHLLGGVCALTGAAVLGPRIGRFGPDGKPADIPGHSVPLTVLGAMLLILGFFAFNGGTEGAIAGAASRAVVQLAVTNTILAGSGGGLVTVLCFKIFPGGSQKWSLLMTINGTLAGMIAICASCNVCSVQPALLVGVLGGLALILVHHAVLRAGVDDPLDAVAVHAGGGALGVLAAPFVARSGGVFDPTMEGWAAAHAVWAQVAGVLAISAWAAATSGALFLALRLAGRLRISAEREVAGMDWEEHGEVAYPPGTGSKTLAAAELGNSGMELVSPSSSVGSRGEKVAPTLVLSSLGEVVGEVVGEVERSARHHSRA